MTYTLHSATPAHLPELARFLAMAVPKTYAEAIAVAQPRYATYLHDCVMQGSTFVLFAEVEAQAVAAAEFRRIPEGLFLNALWVEPTFRGMGIGRAMVEEAVREASPVHVWLDVDERNQHAKAGYLRQGFVEVHRTALSKSSPPDVPSRPDLHTVRVASAERRAFLRYGFCTLELGDERLGMMGSHVLRATSLLSENARIIAKAVFPRRSLWCIGPEVGERVATLVRMRWTP